MINTRNEFLHRYCNLCVTPQNHKGCGQIFQSMLEPALCPEQLALTHTVCKYCLELCPKSRQHDKHCLFFQNDLTLIAAGWSTPVFHSILRSIRIRKSIYVYALINLLRNLLERVNSKTLLIPVPMSSVGTTNYWSEIVDAAVRDLDTLSVLPILRRQKKGSTRKSPAQLRQQIIREEYSIDLDKVSLLQGQDIVLLDDNVTTGNTMVYLSNILKQFGVGRITPVTLERYITARALQRCPQYSGRECPYFTVG